MRRSSVRFIHAQEQTYHNNFSQSPNKHYFPSQNDQQPLLRKLNQLEAKLRKTEERVGMLERQQLTATNWSKSAELLRKQVHQSVGIEQRFCIIDRMLAQLQQGKADRKDNLAQSARDHNERQAVGHMLSQLSQRNRVNQDGLQQLREKLATVIIKMEQCLRVVGEQYQSLIQKHLVKNMHQTNKLALLFQELSNNHTLANQNLRKEQAEFHVKLDALSSKIIQEKQEQSGVNFPCLPGLNLVVSAYVQRTHFIKRSYSQLDSCSLEGAKLASDKSMYTSDSVRYNSFSNIKVLNDLYEPLNSPSSQGLLIAQATYKLDSNFHLLDQQERYLLDGRNRPIVLQYAQVVKLRQHGLVQAHCDIEQRQI